jgi:hypothetical protein
MMVKGNIVKNVRDGDSGIVLAVRKDGTRANIYRYGKDRAEWYPVDWFTVEVAGEEKCFKCLGSGLFYMGGAVVNGKYTGKTGPCYACRGTGQQTDDDRRRCHHYWHSQVEEGEEVESPLEPNPQQPLPTVSEKPKHKHTIHDGIARARERRANGECKTDDSRLIDCKGCGALHRDDVACPW